MELDDVDRGILYLLQESARNNSASSIAEKVGVAPNTVRSRISRLEEGGVIEGYHPHINYGQAGYHFHVVFVCTVPVAEQEAFTSDALAVPGVVRALEILSGRENVAVEAVGEDSSQLTTVASQLEGLGCSISDEWFLKRSRVRPFDGFESGSVESDD